MFEVSEDLVINVTRGDAGAFTLKAKNEDGTPFVFEGGVQIRFKVTERKDCTKVVLNKVITPTENTTAVQIALTESETRNISAEAISKPTDYWYEIEYDTFHNPQTIVGYDEDGAKVLRLYPESVPLPDDEINEEDIPVVDKEIDAASARPIQNQAVAREFIKVNNKIKYVTPEMYGAVGDGKTDDADALNTMLSDTQNAHLPILLTGKYGVSHAVYDFRGHTILPNSAEIVVLDGFDGDFLFTVDIANGRGLQGKYSYHLNLDCGGKCAGFKLVKSIGNSFDLTVKNSKDYGFHLDRGTDKPIYENEIDVRVDCTLACDRGLYVYGNDNMFGNVVVINCKTAIENNGNSHYKYVHCWLDRNAAESYEDSVILLDTANAPSATIDYLYADTYKVGVQCPNYASVHIGTYYVLSGKEEMALGGVTVYHTIFKRGLGGTLSIDVLESYENFDAFQIIENATSFPYITIKEGHCSDFVQTAPMLQLIFPCSISISITKNGVKGGYEANDEVPSAIFDELSRLLSLDSSTTSISGTVQLSPIHMGGTRGFIARNDRVNNLFVSFYSGEYYTISENWKSIAMALA